MAEIIHWILLVGSFIFSLSVLVFMAGFYKLIRETLTTMGATTQALTAIRDSFMTFNVTTLKEHEALQKQVDKIIAKEDEIIKDMASKQNC